MISVGPGVDIRLHELDPDRQCGNRALLEAAERFLLVVPHPHADRDVRIEPDEPGVGIFVDCAGLSGDRPVDAGGGCGRSALHDPSQEICHHERRVGADHVGWLRAVVLELIAFTVAHAQHEERLHPHALIREHRIRARHLDQRRVAGAERDCEIGRKILVEAEPLRVPEHVLRSERIHHAHRRNVA